jgi:hypothetical protein
VKSIAKQSLRIEEADHEARRRKAASAIVTVSRDIGRPATPPVKDFSARVKTISRISDGNSRSDPRCVYDLSPCSQKICPALSSLPRGLQPNTQSCHLNSLVLVLLRKPLVITTFLPRNLILHHRSGTPKPDDKPTRVTALTVPKGPSSPQCGRKFNRLGSWGLLKLISFARVGLTISDSPSTLSCCRSVAPTRYIHCFITLHYTQTGLAVHFGVPSLLYRKTYLCYRYLSLLIGAHIYFVKLANVPDQVGFELVCMGIQVVQSTKQK